MSLFSKYRPIGYKFKEPERITPSEARERRLTVLLEREPRFQAVPNFTEVRKQIQASRSQVKTKNIVNDDIQRRQKAASIAAALRSYSEEDFSDPKKREAYRDLRRQQEAVRFEIQSGGGRRKVNPTGLDLRSFNPTGKETASTRSGTAARLRSALLNTMIPGFKLARQVQPCIQRHAQREVMFAKKYAGKGYHTKKRRTWATGIPC